MNDNLTDNTDICELANRDERDFAEYMAENLPDVGAGSPLWRLHRREYDHETSADRGSVLDDVFPDVTPPAWRVADYDEIADCIVASRWVSPPAQVVLRRHYSEHTDSVVHLPSLQINLQQPVTASEPFVRIARHEMGKNRFAEIVGSKTCLRLDEAAELAHALLLLVDVARDSDDQGDGGAA